MRRKSESLRQAALESTFIQSFAVGNMNPSVFFAYTSHRCVNLVGNITYVGFQAEVVLQY